MRTLQAERAAYARFIVESAGVADARLIAAFAATERERYLGARPWAIWDGSASPPTLTDDARQLYQDVLVSLAAERGINNGQPSLHARCLVACAPAAGETVLHLGAGTGYYSAVLAALVGPTGQVLAYEIEADLAARARHNLRQLANVSVITASATAGALPTADLIYVNAGATHPPAFWLDALKVGGRLIFPLTPDEGYGAMLLVTRRATSSYAASFLMRVAFVPCVGARDETAAQSLTRAFAAMPLPALKSLRRDNQPDDSAWCVGAGWWLSTRSPA